MASISINIHIGIYKIFLYKMIGELIIGLLLFGLLIYGLVTGFDDGNGYDKLN